MSQLSGITPTRTLGQSVDQLLNKKIYIRPRDREPQERPTNTGKRGKSFTGIPGIAFRDGIFTVTSYADGKAQYHGSYVNLRTAVQMLAELKGVDPADLRGVSETMWARLKFQQKFLPNARKRTGSRQS